MGTVNRDRKKIVLDTVHASSVSKAVWPIHTRMHTDIMDNKSRRLKRRHKLPHAAFAISPPSQGNASKHMSTPRLGTSPNAINLCPAGLASALRIAFSLGIAGLALVLSLFYSWTMLLILSLICATITLIMMHLLVNIEHTHLPSAPQYRSNKGKMPHKRVGTGQAQGTVPTAPVHPDPANTGTIGSQRTGASPVPTRFSLIEQYWSASPAPAATSPTLEETQTSRHQQPDSTIPFPTTPMPATPVIRVLDTIDLSSTNIEHFLDT